VIIYLQMLYNMVQGTWWCSWLRYCTTSPKVGLIPDAVIGIFHWRNPSSQHCGHGVDSASNRNEYQGYLLGCKCSRCIGLTTLPPSCANCLEILGASTSWNPQGLYRDCFSFFFFCMTFCNYSCVLYFMYRTHIPMLQHASVYVILKAVHKHH
jgi:hypothetical protein